MKDTRSPTPPLTRAGRRAADAVLDAAKFNPTSDGKRFVRQFEVYGMEVIEWVSAEQGEIKVRIDVPQEQQNPRK